MKKNFKKLLLTLFIIIAIISIFLIINKIMESGNVALIKDKETIIKIINKQYPLYEIKDLKLNYIDWSSTVTNADENHKATKAIVIIENENEEITVYLEKRWFKWMILSDQPNYGPTVPNDLYFVEITYQSVGKSVDIDKHIKKYWVIQENKENYRKVGNDEEWYYSFKYCKNIYKTKDGIVYVFNKEESNWKVATETYSDLCHYGNYKKVDMKYAMGIIEKYSSYKEYIN